MFIIYTVNEHHQLINPNNHSITYLCVNVIRTPSTLLTVQHGTTINIYEDAGAFILSNENNTTELKNLRTTTMRRSSSRDRRKPAPAFEE